MAVNSDLWRRSRLTIMPRVLDGETNPSTTRLMVNWC